MIFFNLKFISPKILFISLSYFLIFLFYFVHFSFANNIEQVSIIPYFNYQETFVEIQMNTSFKKENLINYEIFSKSGILVSYGSFMCERKCNFRANFNKILLDDFILKLGFYDKKKFIEKTYEFSLKIDNLEKEFDFYFNSNYLIPENHSKNFLNISFKTQVFSNINTNFQVEVKSKNSSFISASFNFNCENICNEIFILESPFILGEYEVRVYSNLGEQIYNFSLISEDDLKTLSKDSFGIFTSSDFLVDSQVEISDINNNPLGKFEFNSNFQKGLFNKALFEEKRNIQFNFNSGTLKNIKVPNARFEDIKIGYEQLPLNKVNTYGFNVNNAFAIDPHFTQDILEFEITFVATGSSVYKCEDYNFTTQNCFGDFIWLMDTVPGQEYSITLLPFDPLFIQVNDFLMSPFNASCQSQGSGWDLNNCQDTSLSSSKLCPSGTLGESLFCTDSIMESHSVKRDLPGGVISYFKDEQIDRCDSITKVELIHRVYWSTNTGSRTISISRDGTAWTNVVTNPPLSPTSDIVVDVTNSLGSSWVCDDFFSPTSSAAIQTLWSVTGGSPNNVYNFDVDTLIFRVSFDYESTPLLLDKGNYKQGELVTISGNEIWETNAEIGFNITLPNSSIITLPTVTTNSNNSFLTSFNLDNYASMGEYLILAYQLNNSSINYLINFSVEKRFPFVSSSKKFYSVGEQINLLGNQWGANNLITIEKFLPSGLKEYSFSQSLISNIFGNFNYLFEIPNDLTIETGNYILNFFENLNTSYSSFSPYSIIFRPISASSGAIGIINDTNNLFYNIGGSGGTDNLDISFSQILPNENITLDNLKVNLRYYTSGLTTRTIQWLNPSTLTYEDVCNVPESSSITTFSCDMTIQALQFDSYNNLNIRLSESGGPSIHWNTDFVYLTRDFSFNQAQDPKTINLSLKKTTYFDSTFNISLNFQNLASIQTPLNKSLHLFIFTSNYYQLETYEFQFSSNYISNMSTQNIIVDGIEGNLHTINLYPKYPSNFVFQPNLGEVNSDNSFQANLTFQIDPNFYSGSNLYYVGFDPQEIK